MFCLLNDISNGVLIDQPLSQARVLSCYLADYHLDIITFWLRAVNRKLNPALERGWNPGSMLSSPLSPVVTGRTHPPRLACRIEHASLRGVDYINVCRNREGKSRTWLVAYVEYI